MSVSSDVELAHYYAEIAHSGQVDKAGKPYILHPERVASRMETPEEKIVAWLHDTVEDSNLDINVIEEKFGSDISCAVRAITREKGEDWNEYIQRVKRNDLARKVKISDLIDNSNLTRLNAVTLKDILRQQKYNQALLFLICDKV